MVLASAMKSYSTNLKKGKDIFNPWMKRLHGRLEIMNGYNKDTRRLLFAQNLDYDLEQIVIPDLQTDTRSVQFSHSMLIVSVC